LASLKRQENRTDAGSEQEQRNTPNDYGFEGSEFPGTQHRKAVGCNEPD
jgi:hypothetical protein